MTASFGQLQGQTLELEDGLNILQLPNETGKSTWCAFLLAMLYGINNRERERAGFIPDKLRYAPWSGAPMSGRLDCRAGGRELSLLRSTRRQTSPMGDFQALYTGTGELVAGLTGRSCGEALLGVSREVFERSAFIRQAGLPLSQDPGLERRIASLITSGEEDVSCTEATAALKKQLNRRRYNKTGLIPELEEDLREKERQLAELEDLELQLAGTRAHLEELTRQEEHLSGQLELHDRWARAQKQEALEQARSDAEYARQRALTLRRQLEEDRVPEPDAIGRLRGAIVNLETTRKAANRALAQRDEAFTLQLQAERAVNEHRFTGLTPEQAERLPLDLPPRPRAPLWAVLLAAALTLGLGAAVFFSLQSLPLAVGCGCGAGALPLLLAALLTAKRQKRWEARSAEQRQQRTRDLEEYAALCRAAGEARSDAAAKSAAYDSLYAALTSNEQGILLEVRRFSPAAFDIPAADGALRTGAVRRKELAAAESAAREAQMRLELLEGQSAGEAAEGGAPAFPPPRSREAVFQDLERVRGELSAARSEADRLSGQCRALGDPALLCAAAAHDREQLELLEGEYEALRLALDTLTEANADLQTRFSPALGRRTEEIFRELTGGRYNSVVLDRSLRLSAEPAGDSLYRDAALLSAGAADQLYLSARLAICELVLPQDDPAPIVLDDALANFDDSRCAAALHWLEGAAGTRQILLFTCHSREAAILSGNPAVHVQQLTNPV